MIHLLAAVLVVAAASPSPAPAASPAPCPSGEPAEIGRVDTAVGRATNLVGTATAASEGTINQDQIANRPILRPGDVLEEIPGVVISQHSGEGKANQYYLRGFARSRHRSRRDDRRDPGQYALARARPRLLRHQLADARARELRDVQEGPVLRR